MVRRAASLVLMAALAGCTDRVLIHDIWDAASTPDGAIAPVDTAIVPTDTSIMLPDAGVEHPSRPHPDTGCPTIRGYVKFKPQVASLIILLDRSSNMQGGFPGSYSKVSAIQSALGDAIGTYQSHVWFGFAQFPDPGSYCGRLSCCVGKQPAVAPQYFALNSISNLLQCSDPQGCLAPTADSPSHAALDAVQRYQLSDTDRYVLLIAASEPSCGSDDVCPAAFAATAGLGSMDIPVVVLTLGYQPDERASCLVGLSRIGSKSGMPEGAVRLYTPPSTTDLKANLSTLFAAIARSSCRLSTYDYVPDDAVLTVPLGNNVLQQHDCSASSGWCFTPNVAFHNEITLLGSSCDEYLRWPHAEDIKAGYSCSTCTDSNAYMPPW